MRERSQPSGSHTLAAAAHSASKTCCSNQTDPGTGSTTQPALIYNPSSSLLKLRARSSVRAGKAAPAAAEEKPEEPTDQIGRQQRSSRNTDRRNLLQEAAHMKLQAAHRPAQMAAFLLLTGGYLGDLGDPEEQAGMWQMWVLPR